MTDSTKKGVLDPNMSDQEKKCIRILAKLFGEGNIHEISEPRKVLAREGLALDHASYAVLMKMMDQYGVLGLIHSACAPEGEYMLISVSPVAVQLARELEARDKEKEIAVDLYESMKLTTRRKPFLAWPLMVLVVAIFVATAINQIGGAFKVIREICAPTVESAKPAPPTK